MKKIRRNQMSFYDIDLNQKIAGRHDLYEIKQIIDLSKLVYRIKPLEKKLGRSGYGIDVGLACMFLQFFYDLSDREMEKRLRFDMAFLWFCGFSAYEETPDHSYFCRFRKTLGTKGTAQIFKLIVKKTKDLGIMRSMFQFADATSIITKNTTWDERDLAIKKGEEALNNRNIKKHAADPQARFGCKGKGKFWYGYKGHVGVDMGSGLIERVAVTPANISDQEGFKHICPREGQMVFADKAYCLKKAQDAMFHIGATSAAILRQNMIGKNKDLDRFRSAIRAPFEGVFSKFEKRARYRGHAKIQFQLFMEAIVHNAKRLVRINAPPLFVGA
jgi:IS5 family transposase